MSTLLTGSVQHIHVQHSSPEREETWCHGHQKATQSRVLTDRWPDTREHVDADEPRREMLLENAVYLIIYQWIVLKSCSGCIVSWRDKRCTRCDWMRAHCPPMTWFIKPLEHLKIKSFQALPSWPPACDRPRGARTHHGGTEGRLRGWVSCLRVLHRLALVSVMWRDGAGQRRLAIYTVCFPAAERTHGKPTHTHTANESRESTVGIQERINRFSTHSL